MLKSKKTPEIFGGNQKMLYLCTRNQERNGSDVIGIWCNGNTADSGPAFPGSSPGIPTENGLTQ